MARRLTALRERLGELHAWLASVPRRLRRATARRWAVAAPLAALLLALGMGTAQANTITVDVGAGGNCSLAEAIGNANDTTTGQPNTDCGDGDEAGADLIQFADANTTYSYTSALPAITTAVTIQGNGNTTIQRTGGPAFSVLVVSGGGSLGLANATISGGSAAAGAGIYANGSTLSLTSATISGNTASFYGGGIAARSSSVGLTSATISGNSTGYDGGGIWTYGSTVSLISATISGNTAADDGGGLYARLGSVSLSSTTISGNTAAIGGGIETRFSTLSLTSATISDNTAGNYGGGIMPHYTTVDMTGGTISGNTASGGHGGGVFARGISLSLTSATVSGNSSSQDGGGMWAFGGTVGLTGATISGNTAGEDGGGASFTNGSAVVIRSSTISGNSAGEAGGGLDLGYSTLNIYGSTIRSNSASYGGGIHADGALLVIFDSTISGNTANNDGGGIASYEGGSYLTNATLSGNSAGQNGGGLDSDSGLVAIQFSTITGNSAGGAGGGIHSNYSLPIRNSIVAAQAAGADCAGTPPISGGYNIESGTGCDFTATGDLQNVSGAALNLGALNLNAPGSTQTHALGTGSAALDRIPNLANGCNTDVSDDQRGVARPQDGACDVGSYELQPAPMPPTAAQVTHFAAAPDPTGRIRITWETTSEVDVVGFRVERASAGGPWRAVGGLVPARGSAAGGDVYTVTDAPGVGRFAYRLEVVEAGGAPRMHGPVEAVVRTLRAFLPVGWR